MAVGLLPSGTIALAVVFNLQLKRSIKGVYKSTGLFENFTQQMGGGILKIPKTINFKGKLYYPKKTAFIFWISELGGNAATTDESSNDSHANDPIDPIIFS